MHKYSLMHSRRMKCFYYMPGEFLYLEMISRKKYKWSGPRLLLLTATPLLKQERRREPTSCSSSRVFLNSNHSSLEQKNSIQLVCMCVCLCVPPPIFFSFLFFFARPNFHLVARARRELPGGEVTHRDSSPLLRARDGAALLMKKSTS